MAAELAFTFFDKLLDVIGLVRDSQRAKKIEKKEAIEAIVRAVHQTQRYIQSREQGAPRDKEREWTISEIWRQASISVGVVDPALGRICWDKGGYWMNPDIWSTEMIEAKGIAIAQMEEKVPELMGLGKG